MPTYDGTRPSRSVPQLLIKLPTIIGYGLASMPISDARGPAPSYRRVAMVMASEVSQRLLITVEKHPGFRRVLVIFPMKSISMMKRGRVETRRLLFVA